jgi:hypothetical protein
MPKIRRALSILSLVVFVGLPLAAQPQREPGLPFLSFLSTLWERLTAPAAGPGVGITALWEADEPNADTPTPPPQTVSKGGWDPNG